MQFNDDWKYNPEFKTDMIKKNYDDSGWEDVRIPHTNAETPYHYFDESIYQFVSCYRKHINVEPEWKGKKVLLTFDGIAHIAKIYVNEKPVISHYGGYTGFTADISSYLDFEGDNILVVEVDSREDNNIPPFGNVIDYMTYGGIYREVSLEIKEPTYIKDVFVTTKEVNNECKSAQITVTLSETENEELTCRYVISGGSGEDKYIISSDLVPMTNQVAEIESMASFVQNWDISNPILYDLEVELYDGERILDKKSLRFGYRTCEFRNDGFYLNNRKIKLIGLNRHQSYPYVGYAMPKRMQRRDAEILKYELGVNAVRTSHYPHSKHFIDRCDELGLLVFTELPGWQHIGDEKWKEVAINNVEEMILQYRNHPSIILWGVRINESIDDDAFYTKTNQVAHKLDPTRQTGGVRYLKKSNLLEDVYTYNDFLHNGKTKGLDRKKDVTSKEEAPYLVTEYNGHMFPTKSFDNEEHRLSHALRHARVMDALFENKDITGGFGWCMFDYNTHKDFGSGDRICYHGVMDMFRNQKLAASVYASQGEEQTVFEISSSMNIGEYPGGAIGSVYAFTNADSVKVYKSGSFIKEFYPDKEQYKYLPHPPIIIDDFVGELMEKQEKMDHKTSEKVKDVLFAVNKYGQNNLPISYKLKMVFIMIKNKWKISDGVRLFTTYIANWGGEITTYRFDAIRNGKIVKSIEKSPVKNPRLLVEADTLYLKEEETYDVAEVRIKAVDDYGNLLSYYQEPLQIQVSGAIKLIGPSTISLRGGTSGIYIRTDGTTGLGKLVIKQEQLGNKELDFVVE